MLVGGGDAERFHFAVEVGALQADGGGGLRHVPAIFLKFAQDKFAFVGAAGFVKRAVGLLGAFDDAAEIVRAGDDAVRCGLAGRRLPGAPRGCAARGRFPARDSAAEFRTRRRSARAFFAVSGAEFIEEVTSENGNVCSAIAERRNEKGNDVEAIEKILAEIVRGRFPVRVPCWWRR